MGVLWCIEGGQGGLIAPGLVDYCLKFFTINIPPMGTLVDTLVDYPVVCHGVVHRVTLGLDVSWLSLHHEYL